MNRPWKYVIIEHPDAPGIEIPVLLPSSGLEHKVVRRIGLPVSAGFCEFTATGVFTWGASESLGLVCRLDVDGKILSRWFINHPNPAPARPESAIAI